MNTKPVYIVAGGPSLMDFDWKSLDGQDVIAINNAAFKLPNAKYVYFANTDWFKQWRNQLKAHRGKIIQGCTDQDVKEDWVENWQFVNDRLALKPRTLHPGGNSGYAAINLAVQLGYKEINLLGYDMKYRGEQANFHSDHTWWTPRDGFEHMLLQFSRLVDPLKAAGVEVFNLTPDSELKVFPFKQHSES